MKGKPLGSLLFFSLAELYFLLMLAIGIWEKKIPVMLGHFDYGDASFTSHPVWYTFGVMEWAVLCMFCGFIIWRVWKRG